MKLGICGLGKMGMNLVLNMLDNNHDVVAYDVNSSLVKEAEKRGAIPAYNIEELINGLSTNRIIWLMVPEGEITENLLGELDPYLKENDVLIDGGNSYYKDTIKRNEKYKKRGCHYIDVGTSGGVEGARYGACMMVGGDKKIVKKIEKIFYDITVKNGYLYTGNSGSGHFLKMIHNGIEYGIMQSIGEGFDILSKSSYDYDFEAVAKVWNNGSVIRSWLMELLEDAFSKDADLDELKGVVHASGEGKWTVETAMELETAVPVIALSLMMRNRSLETDTFSGKVVASLRNQFGGHEIINKE